MEHQPFLDHEHDNDTLSDSERGASEKLVKQKKHYRGGFYVNVFAFFCNVVLFIGLVIVYQTIVPADGVSKPYSPANDAIQYEQKVLYHHGTENPFVGSPGPALDDAWHELTYGTLIHVSQEEMDQANMTSIRFRDGSYVAGLGVFHELHCLKKFKHYMHKEHYYAGTAAEEMEHIFGHLNHCMEVIRQSIMCRADYSLYTFAWDTPDQVKPRTVTDGWQKCVAWDHLQEWVLERASGPHPDWLRMGEDA